MVEQRQLRRFACGPTQHNLLMRVFARAFSATDATLYRLDALNDELPFALQSNESIVFFHFTNLNHQAISFDRGREVVHMIGVGVKYLDASGRYPNEATGCRVYLTPELWG
jgi:hypothetical protein